MAWIQVTFCKAKCSDQWIGKINPMAWIQATICKAKCSDRWIGKINPMAWIQATICEAKCSDRWIGKINPMAWIQATFCEAKCSDHVEILAYFKFIIQNKFKQQICNLLVMKIILWIKIILNLQKGWFYCVVCCIIWRIY